MWVLVRGLALAVVAGVGLVLAGAGGWLFDLVDDGVGLVGAGPVTPRADATLPTPAVLGGVGGGVVLALARPLDRAVGQLVTLLHELGHTLVAAALGARPAGIVLRHDASGHATARWVEGAGRLRRLALAAVAFAGLPAAAVASAAGAQLLALAGPEAVLWSAAAAGAIVAVLARSLWSLLIAVGVAGLAVAALGDAAEPWAAGVVVTVLAATAVKTTVDNVRALRRRLQPGDDARVVGRYLPAPARMVQVVQVLSAAVLSVWTLWLLLTALPEAAPFG